jgi:hypothetical protein
MNLIERWTIQNPPSRGPRTCRVEPISVNPDAPMGRKVEVVPADRLQGAVEALQAIAADPQIGGTGHPVDVLARNALEALGLAP